MSIPGIEGIGFTPFTAPVVGPTGPGRAAAPSAASGVDFAGLVTEGINNLEGVHDRSASLAVQAATGDLTNIHDYTIAATEAATTTQLTAAVRNKALEAFQEIMRISI